MIAAWHGLVLLPCVAVLTVSGVQLRVGTHDCRDGVRRGERLARSPKMIRLYRRDELGQPLRSGLLLPVTRTAACAELDVADLAQRLDRVDELPGHRCGIGESRALGDSIDD